MSRFFRLLAASALTTALAASCPAQALTLHKLPEVRADNDQGAVEKVSHRYRRGGHGGISFSFGFGSPYYGPGFYSYEPYDPYYEPYYAPRYYAPAPYSYEPEPYQSDPTGRCPAGQEFRYPIGCVPS